MKKILFFCLMLLLLAGCEERTMRYTAKDLKSNIEPAKWMVSFSALDGNLTEGFIVNPKEYPFLHYDIASGGGKMIVQVKQDSEITELPHEKGTLSLEKFREGSLYLQILGEGAKDGRIYFECSHTDAPMP